MQAQTVMTEETPSTTAEWTEGWPQTPEAFEQLVDTYQEPLIRYAFRRLRDPQEAEDAAQDVFLRVFAERRKLQAVRRVRPYLYRMMANACADRLRRKKRHGERFISESDCCIESIADHRETAPAQVAAAEDLERVERLLAGLPKHQAEVVRLRVLDELPFSDIAVVLGCRLSTVKSRLRYGLLKLRRIVKREA